MKAILFLAAVLAAAYLLWDGYRASTPEGKARSADMAAIKHCRSTVSAETELAVMNMRARECAKLQAEFDRKW